MQVDVTINRGKVKMDVQGGYGASCESVTASYKDRLAVGAVDRELKPEYHNREPDERVKA